MKMSYWHYNNADFKAAHAAIVQQHWLSGTTREPADRARAEDAVLWLYHFAGLDKPKITWVPSWPEMVSYWLVDTPCPIAPAELAEMNWYANYPDFNPLRSWQTPKMACYSSAVALCLEELDYDLTGFFVDEANEWMNPYAHDVNEKFTELFIRANIAAVERTLLRGHAPYLNASNPCASADIRFWHPATAKRGPIIASHWINPLGPEFLCAAMAFEMAFARKPSSAKQPHRDRLHMVNEICLASHAAALCDQHAILCERPVQTEMQKDGGPRLVYADGWKVWEFQRVPMPRQVVDAPGEISKDMVARESDQEIRFSMMHVLRGDSRAAFDRVTEQ
ncbi:MAG: hypothetical protein KBG84_12230 [Planctomycetes bacterium]|nr:hypothetical protein [Planctomycetota bacterium]